MVKYSCVVITLIVLFSSCAPDEMEVLQAIQTEIGTLPTSPIHPTNNPSSQEKITLGKALFWDPILSGNKDVACVSCHHPQNAYAEMLDLSIGVGGTGLSSQRENGTLVQRNSISIVNSAFNGMDENGNYSPANAEMFWDSRVQSLEAQAIEPILSAEEMRGTEIPESAIIDTVIQRLSSIPEYNSLFTNAFGPNSINEENIGKAIATFERTLISANSRFDQYVAGNESALSQQEIRGMDRFINVGCADCHSGTMFSDFELHVLTVPENNRLDEPDTGDGNFAFRTASLRNAALTAPYMHNGVFETLEEVLDFYNDAENRSQNDNVPNNQRDQELRDLDLGNNDENAIIAFIRALTDDGFDDSVLNEVPSGLNPGGNID